MGRSRKKPTSQYDFIALEVSDYSASVDAAISYEVRDPRHFRDDAPVHRFHSSIEVNCASVWPEERAGVPHLFTLHGDESEYQPFDMTLDDCQVRNEDGSLKFRKVSGQLKPVYNIPRGIGLLEKVRGENCWTGHGRVSPACLSDMLVLLVGVRPLYVFIHEYRYERHHWFCGFTLQTRHPAAD